MGDSTSRPNGSAVALARRDAFEITEDILNDEQGQASAWEDTWEVSGEQHARFMGDSMTRLNGSAVALAHRDAFEITEDFLNDEQGQAPAWEDIQEVSSEGLAGRADPSEALIRASTWIFDALNLDTSDAGESLRTRWRGLDYENSQELEGIPIWVLQILLQVCLQDVAFVRRIWLAPADDHINGEAGGEEG